MSIHLGYERKRSITAIILMLSIAPLSWALPGGDTATSASANGKAPNQPATPSSNAAPSPAELELEQLKANVEAQSKAFEEHSKELEAERAALRDEIDRIANLEHKLGITPGASAAPSQASAALVSNPAQQSQTQAPQDWSNRIANLEDRLKNFGPFTLSGDFRLRGEPFLGGPADHSLDRTRERYRLRFNIDTHLNQDFSGGLSLGSGDVNDPTSTNQNVTGFYTRKPFFIDKAYINYNPHQFKNLTLIGGKFAYPWYNTELTWDKDLNPEGLAQTLAFNLHTPLLKKIAFVGFELPFGETARTSPTNKSIVESTTYGGQVQTSWQFTPWLKFGAYSGFYNFHRADPIALALARANTKNPQTALSGLLPLGTGNTVQNSIYTTTATDFVTIGGTNVPTGVTTITNAQFASKFGLLDSLARFDVKTPSAKWPVAIIGDYVQNTEACANLPNIQPPPATSAPSASGPGLKYSQTVNFACNSDQRRGYWAEAQVGRAQKRGDWQFDYARIFIEREAVLSNFNYSEIRQGSNVTEHRASVLYQVNPNVQLSFVGLIGRPLNFGSSKPPEPWLERLQFDVLYSF